MGEVGLQEIAQDTGNLLKHIESLVQLGQYVFSIDCVCVGVCERSLYIVIAPGVLVVWRDVISTCVYWTLPRKIEMWLEMM
jgi:hypothetical protein